MEFNIASIDQTLREAQERQEQIENEQRHLQTKIKNIQSEEERKIRQLLAQQQAIRLLLDGMSKYADTSLVKNILHDIETLENPYPQNESQYRSAFIDATYSLQHWLTAVLSAQSKDRVVDEEKG